MFFKLAQASAVLYLAAGVSVLVYLAVGRTGFIRAGRFLLIAGLLLQAGAIAGVIHFSSGGAVPSPVQQAVTFLAFAIVGLHLLFSLRYGIPGFAAPIAILAFLLTFYASFPRIATGVKVEETVGLWPHLHMILALIGLALFGFAFLAGILYLLEERRLKDKRVNPTFFRMPPLEVLDRVNTLCLMIGLPLLTLGMVTGSIWISRDAGRLWTWAPHEVFALVTWSLYVGLAFLRFYRKQRGRRAAWGAVLGFVVAVGGYFSTRLI